MPVDFSQPNLLTGGSNKFSPGLKEFSTWSPQRVAELAQEAPDACGGNDGINSSSTMENCIKAVCAARNSAAKGLSDSTGFGRPEFFNALLRHPLLSANDPMAFKALRYHWARSMADVFCKDPPNDGTRAVVTERQPTPVKGPDWTVAFVGLAALAAVRLGSLVYPELRPASPGLIQGIYLWMGITPPEEFFAPTAIDGIVRKPYELL